MVMPLYYGIITLAVVMFGVQFFFNERFQKEYGSSVRGTFLFNFCSSVAGLLCLLIINRFAVGFTSFTLLMATLAAINSLLYTFCAIKAFAHINLSVFSIFAMLGGMLLPFVFGILFYHEGWSLGKGLCILLIVAALTITVKRGEKKGGFIYYAGVFTLNGMSGVISKVFTAAPYEKANSASYSIWIAIIGTALSGVVLLFMLKGMKRPSLKALGFTLGYGSINKVANFLLLLALAVLPASVQYPFVTGGTMIVSCLISALRGERPSWREWVSVALSFVGILFLVFLP
ncbi:MAG: hypothetical protein E7639_03450 [Ruminococcaceae bacterium]|nr:hypothetical protein [Oscillospiraceae bacterium]